jgi:hypothetical protein
MSTLCAIPVGGRTDTTDLMKTRYLFQPCDRAQLKLLLCTLLFAVPLQYGSEFP